MENISEGFDNRSSSLRIDMYVSLPLDLKTDQLHMRNWEGIIVFEQ